MVSDKCDGSRDDVKNLKKSSKAMAFAILIGALPACGPKNLNSHPQAPMSKAEAGWIVRFNASEKAQEICSLEGVECRELHKATHTYEVFNLDGKELKEAAPDAKLQKNIYFERLTNRKPASFHTQYTLPQFLKECTSGPNPPKPVIDVVAPGNQIKNSLVEFGTRVQATASKSTASVGETKALEFLWIIMSPSNALGADPKEAYGAGLDLTPDMPGGYTLMLFAKDSRKICARTSLEFGVTVNQPFLGHKAPRPFDANDAKLFAHLPMISAREALNHSAGQGIVIAVVDTGVNYNHPDLRQNTWVNTKEIAGNGVDDDHNGLVDDVVGWDFVSGDRFPTDDDMHGTHVAGLAASGVSGVAPKAQIMAVKAMNAMGGGDLASIQGAIMYAADQGAQVINLSLGAYMDSEGANPLKPAVDYAEKKGSLIVAAAGNGDDAGVSVDTDATPNFPSCFANPAILSVASVGINGELATYSNFGLTSVDLAAPGGDPSDGGVFSTFYLPEQKLYIPEMGTSMATPVTAGAAAVVWSANRSLSATQVKSVLMKTVTAKTSLKGKMVEGGIIDVLRAAQAAKTP